MSNSRTAIYYITSPLLFLLSTQTGCLMHSSYDYYSNSPDAWELQAISEAPTYRRDQVRSAFHMEIDGTRLRGWVVQSTTFIFTFLPGITVLIVGHNPYHIELVRKEGECPPLHVMSVSMEDLEGNILFRTEAGEEILTQNGPAHEEWVQVFNWGHALTRIPRYARQVKVCIEYMPAELLRQNSPSASTCVILERHHFTSLSGLGGN